MSTTPPAPVEAMQEKLDHLERFVRNCLIENPNFKPVEIGDGRLADGVYFTHYPTSRAFVEGPLRTQANSILKQLAELREMSGANVTVDKIGNAA